MANAISGKNLRINVNNFNLSYDDIGEREIPIIFLNGYPFDKNMWAEQIEFLMPTQRVIACDIRGFGKSTDEEAPLSIELFADDLIKLMDLLDINKAILCGLSMGGFIALNAMKRFPSRFSALILCDTQCIADTDELKKKRNIIIEEIKENGPRNFMETFIKSVFHPKSLTEKTELVALLSHVVFTNTKHIIKQGLIALAEREETCTTLSEIDIPTLIICGREDAVTLLAQSEYMHNHIKNSKLHIIENAGHVSNLEQRDEFNKALDEFLTGLTEV